MRKKGQMGLHVEMSPEQLQAVHELAASQNFKFTSDYVRQLIEDDARRRKVSIDLSVNRGGYRGRKAKRTEK